MKRTTGKSSVQMRPKSTNGALMERLNSFYENIDGPPQIKVVVIGESGAGKSNLIAKLVEDRFDPRSKSTIGIDFSRYDFAPEGDVGHLYRIQIWDTAGQERYRSSMTNIFYRDVAGILLVFDLTKRDHFQALSRWLEEIHTNCLDPEPIPIVLIGNKSDQTVREVTPTEGESFARRHCLTDYVETSAKYGTNVEAAFRSLFNTIIYGNPRPELVTVRKKKKKVKYITQRVDSIRLGHARPAAITSQQSVVSRGKSPKPAKVTKSSKCSC